MNVQESAAVIARTEPPLSQRRQASYVFTIKIVEGEDLKAMDINGASDPYVVVGDEYQKRLHKTRVIYANLNPRWDETFEITVQGPVYLTFTIWDWDTLGDHDCVGRTSIKLDPAHFSDYLPKVCVTLSHAYHYSNKDVGILARARRPREDVDKSEHGRRAGRHRVLLW